MVKEYSGKYQFPFKWEIVAAGFWVKYPNPFSKHVISEDVISRHITEDNILITKRLLVKERLFHLPKWADSFVTLKHVYVVEESHCDPVRKTLTSYTRNFSLTSYMTVLEKCVYYKDPSNPDSTLCTKQANIYSPLFGAGAAIERYGLMKFKKSADKASLGLQWISEKILEKFLKSGQ